MMRDELLRAVAFDRPLPLEEAGRGDAQALARNGLLGLALRRGFPASGELTALVRKTTSLNLLEARRIAGAAERRGLAPAILLKGPAIAEKYADPSVRTYTDLDVLVPARARAGWESLLISLGFEQPSPWKYRRARMFGHAVAYARGAGGYDVICDLHTRLSIDRRAARLDYSSLRSHSSQGSTGFLHLDRAAQLVVCVVHLVHHLKDDRKMIWYRDIEELVDAYKEAQVIADRLDVAWALDAALKALDAVRAGRDSVTADSGAYARMLDSVNPGYRFHLRTAQELGVRKGSMYVLSLLDPRRFDDSGDSFPAWLLRRFGGGGAGKER